ncbi:MAG: N-acetyl-gamma-glutamyl-phosphate reductase, partial [Sedimentisphaerales bacterium]|nr:N-acetyl-gamma-glutamyl-phosphate reductase [Sedimentisphaerales bacterium]
MVNVAIIGASGYTGAESIEILLRHPKARLTYLSALPEECGRVEEVFGQFKGRCDFQIEPFDLDKMARLADVVLCCLPHKVSMAFVPKILAVGLKVVDLSADYRIKDVAVYERYYQPHTDPGNLGRAVYGLPELFRQQIKATDLVANPGCFPTASLLGTAPLLRAGVIDLDSPIVVNAVTGVSGGGKTPTPRFHFPNMNENLFAYGIGTHRHRPEMEQIASQIAGRPVRVLFQPHVGPFDRGIFSTIYCRPARAIDSQQLIDLFADFYAGERFVQVCRT